MFHVSRSLRRHRLSWIVAVVAGLFLLAACAAPKPQPLIFGPPVWQDGEVSQYRIVDSRGQYLGAMHYDIVRNGTDGWTVQRELLALGQEEVISVAMEGEGYRPQRSQLSRTGGSGRHRVEADFVDGQVNIALTSPLGNTVYERIDVPSDVREERTLLVIVRALPLARGYATRLNTFLPVTGQLERVTVQVRKAARVTVPAGSFDTWLVTLRSSSATSQAWIGREAPHPMVKFADGRSKAIFELTEFHPHP